MPPTNDATAIAAVMTRMYEDTILRKKYQEAGPKRATDFAKPLMVDKFVEMLDGMHAKARQKMS